MTKLTAMNHSLSVDEIQTLVPWLTDNDREMQRRALTHFAGHARAQLEGVPEYWHFMFQAYPKDVLDIRAEYDKKGLPYPQWRLDVLNAPDGVSGLIYAMETCNDRKARRWRFAALLLWHCMLAMETGSARVVRFIPALALRCDAERGQGTLASASQGGKRHARFDKAELRAAYREERPKARLQKQALLSVAERFGCGVKTVRRAFADIGETPP